MLSYFYFFLAIIITIFVHEIAHLFIALIVGTKVEIFSIGFGKTLLHKKLFGIDFRLSAIPLGGYCRLEGEKSKIKEGWLAQRYSKKILVCSAGVIANLLLVFGIYILYYKSISYGLWFDFHVIRYLLTKELLVNEFLLQITKPMNAFIIQLTVINLCAAIANMIPFPALDGGYIWLFHLERIYKEKFPEFLERITKIGFVLLIISQVILIYWIWLI